MKKTYNLLIIGLALVFLQPALAKAQVYVKQGASGSGSSWANATGDLQAAIDAAATATVKEVWVAAGTYEATNGTLDTRGFVMKNGVAIYGGFPANNNSATMADRNWKTYETILTGSNTHRVIVNNGNALSSSAVLDGFIVENGKRDGQSGGGIYNNGGSAGNVQTPVYRNLVVRNNQGLIGGSAGGNGGGMCNSWAAPTLINILFTGNKSQRGGALFCNNQASAKIINVTITGNSGAYAGDPGSAIYLGSAGTSSIELSNSVIYGNSTPAAAIHTDNANNGVTAKNSLVQELAGFTVKSGSVDNIDADPRFTSTSDFTLQSTSPAVNAGSDALFTGLDANTKDLAGNSRKYGTGNIDMGAYEYQGTLPVSLISFTAKADGNRAKLQWQTASESNNQGFIIYRSGDDGVFVKLGEVSSSSSNNSSSSLIPTATACFFTDPAPLNGNNYYKLVQVDNDGTATELGVKTVTFRLQPSILSLYPNPTENQLAVAFEVGKYSQLQLADINGKVLQSVAINNTENSKTLVISAYPAGVYIVKLSGTTQIEIKKVIKK